MSLQELFADNKLKYKRLVEIRTNDGVQDTVACPICGTMIGSVKMERFHYVCSCCGHYFPMAPRDRIRMICDAKSFHELGRSMETKDPLEFPGYKKKLAEAQEKTGACDAVLTGTARIKKNPVAVAVMDNRFFMGSMGTVVGEKIALLTEYAAKRSLPLLIFSTSGGARMQEGMFSLMQMAKTAAAVERFKNAGGLFISVLTHPTTGGVSASFATLGDIILAEPKALIGFAGPRVIEQTIGHTLPEGFQHSEFLIEHGMIDRIVERREQRDLLGTLLKMHRPGKENA